MSHHDEASFSHVTEDGSVTMVDVGHKESTSRTAIVRCTWWM